MVDHPALEGNTRSFGADGSTVEDLLRQIRAMLTLDPLPDVVIIQTIDNDIRCDGTDAENFGPFGDTLEEVLSTIESQDENARVFFVSQWGSVALYARAVSAIPAAESANSGEGLCDLFTTDGRPNRKAQSCLHGVVDHYFDRIGAVCRQHPSCYTDGGLLQEMRVRPEDLTADFNHLSVQGQAAMAALAWEALPDAIKERP